VAVKDIPLTEEAGEGKGNTNFKKEYYQTSGDAVGTANNRLVHFLYRLNLHNQFIAEEAQGKR
jgi:hypothetical protein